MTLLLLMEKEKLDEIAKEKSELMSIRLVVE